MCVCVCIYKYTRHKTGSYVHMTLEFPKKQTTPTLHSNSTGRDAQKEPERQHLVRLELCNMHNPHKDQAALEKTLS